MTVSFELENTRISEINNGDNPVDKILEYMNELCDGKYIVKPLNIECSLDIFKKIIIEGKHKYTCISMNKNRDLFLAGIPVRLNLKYNKQEFTVTFLERKNDRRKRRKLAIGASVFHR